MNIRKYYPSNIIKSLRNAVRFQKNVMLYSYFMTHPFERDAYYSILSYFKGDERRAAEYIKEHGFMDPRFLLESSIVVSEDTNSDRDVQSIIDEIKNKK